MQTTFDNTEKLPILGLDKELYGYIIGEKFHVCNAEGVELPRKYSTYLILGVYSDCYSINIYKNTTKLLIVDNNGVVVSNPDQESPYLNYKRLNDNTIVCINDFIYPTGYKEFCNVFHPMQYIRFNILSRCISIKDNKAIIIGEKYYLFSMLGLHFFADLNELEITYIDNEPVKDFLHIRYYVLDENGDLIKEWNNKKPILELWQRTNGSFSIIEKSAYSDVCNSQNYTGEEDLLSIYSLSDQYEKNWEQDYEEYKSYYEYDDVDQCKTFPKETYIEYKLLRFSKTETKTLDKNLINFLYPNWYFSDKEHKISCYLNNIKFDDYYLICFTDLGFLSFSTDKFIVSKELIDKSDFIYKDRHNYYKNISNYQFRNTLIGYYIEDIEEILGDEGWYKKYTVGDNYYLTDINGCPIGVTENNLFSPYTNLLGFPEVYGVLDTHKHSFIVPPLYKSILPLERYTKESSHDSKTWFRDENPYHNCKENTNSSTIYNDNIIYLVELCNWRNEDILTKGVYCNDKFLIALGDNDIVKIHDQYFLYKSHSDINYSLFYHSGKKICDNIKNAEAINIYNMYRNTDWRGDFIPDVYLINSLVKAYVDEGFLFVIDGCIVFDAILESITPIIVNSKEIIFNAIDIEGKAYLLSYKDNIITNICNFEGVKDVKILSSSHNISDHRPQEEILVSKYGNKFCDDEIKEIKENGHRRFFDEKNKQQDLIYTKFMIQKHISFLEEATEINPEIVGRFRIGNFGIYRASIIQQITMPIKSEDFDKLYIYGDDEIGNNGACLLICYNDETISMYDTIKGFIFEHKPKSSTKEFNGFFIFNTGEIISKYGKLIYNKGELEFIASIENEALAYYVSSLNEYIIIENNGYVIDNLSLIEPGLFVWPNHKDTTRQYTLNTTKKLLTYKILNESNSKSNDNYDIELQESYCPEWTIEDSWEAMTDGHDVDGSWDNDIFG